MIRVFFYHPKRIPTQLLPPECLVPLSLCLDIDLPIVHAHFSPPRKPEEAQATYESYHASAFLVSSPPHWDADSTVSYMSSADIGFQLLSNIPQTIPKLRESNDFGDSLVKLHPTKFGLLAAISTDDGEAALSEAIRGLDELADGIAVTACYKDHWLSDPDLKPLWEELDKRGESVHIHPNAYAGSHLGRPAPLIEVAFESARGTVEMLYSGMLQAYPNIKFIMYARRSFLPDFGRCLWCLVKTSLTS